MKKARHTSLALICLLLVILLTVGCASVTPQASEKTPAPDTTSGTDAPSVTEPQQTEPAPVETEPAIEPVTKDPYTPVVPLYDTEKTGFSSGVFSVIIDNRVYYANPDGIYRMYEGREALLYSGSFTEHWVCTDGKLLYAVDAAGDVIRLDLISGNVTKLFNAGLFAYVVGASDEVLYLGLQEDENDWWGYDVCAYSLDGVLQKELGTDLDVSMMDGILCCSDFRSDVRTVPFRAYDRNGVQIVDAAEMSTYCVSNGAIYYTGLNEGYTWENVTELDPYAWGLFRVDGSGTSILAVLPGGSAFGGFSGDTVLRWGEKMYDMENGTELPRNLVDSLLCPIHFMNCEVGKDENGKWYSIDLGDATVLRENDAGELILCDNCPELANYIGICGDWIYTYDPYYGTITVTGTYVPAP